MRLVVTRRNRETVLFRLGEGSDAPCDTYRDRLLKYVPAETLVLFVALYGSASALMAPGPGYSAVARWIILVCLLATPLILGKILEMTDLVQILISAIGFVVWVFALGVVPVTELPGYNQVAAAFVLLAYVFLVPLVDGVPDRF